MFWSFWIRPTHVDGSGDERGGSRDGGGGGEIVSICNCAVFEAQDAFLLSLLRRLLITDVVVRYAGTTTHIVLQGSENVSRGGFTFPLK